jgi:hypothetical protein
MCVEGIMMKLLFVIYFVYHGEGAEAGWSIPQCFLGE